MSTDDTAAPHPRGVRARGGPHSGPGAAAAHPLSLDAEHRRLALALIVGNPRGVRVDEVHAAAWLAAHHAIGTTSRWFLFTPTTAGPVSPSLAGELEVCVDAGLVSVVRAHDGDRYVATAEGMRALAALPTLDRVARRALVRAAYHRDPAAAVRAIAPGAFDPGLTRYSSRTVDVTEAP